jgi:NAD-dependent dihydropyrimidine dehydrogenase PreA subunit
MTYVIAEPCIDVKDKAYVDECPAACIYEGEPMLSIHPDECVDCGACEPACPVEAIFYEDDAPEQWAQFTTENAKFFDQLGSPAAPPRPARRPTTPTTSPATSPAGNATMSVRQISGSWPRRWWPVPGSPAALAAPPASK